jgi:hypothetical protein
MIANITATAGHDIRSTTRAMTQTTTMKIWL